MVPYALEWISGNDAEMGLVQTEPQARKAAGGYWFYGSAGSLALIRAYPWSADEMRIELHEATPGQRWDMGRYVVIALRARHAESLQPLF